MPNVTEAALKERARALLVGMTERSRWVYALPRDGFPKVRDLLEAEGMKKVAEEAEGHVTRYASEGSEAAFVVFDSADLDVALIEAEGDAAVPTMQKLLELTGFFPQSKLWGEALDIGGPRSTTSLKILAHMAVAWDEDWTDLFLLHLASPDAMVRREALSATTLAAMVAREAGPAIELLEEARQREKFPKLAETIDEGLRVLKAVDGQPLPIDQLPTDVVASASDAESND
ncbi:MAG TPA: hypothetical protein ENK57_01435 [Polyangiaceae bacterium]|nr:hypothetical protein [Polyangiaceae bacterium]